MDLTIKKISEQKVKITLSQQELTEFSVEYEQLDCGDDDTRDFLLQLLELAWQATGFYPEEGRLYVEAYPDADGCTIFFAAAAERDTAASVCTPVAFYFETVDDLLQGAPTLFYRYGHRIHKSALYQTDSRYILIIHPLDQSGMDSVLLLSEYGQPFARGDLAAAVIGEHCRTVIEKDALEKLSGSAKA